MRVLRLSSEVTIAYTAAEAPVTQFLYFHIQTRKHHVLMQQREREMVKAGSKLRIYYKILSKQLKVEAVCPMFSTYSDSELQQAMNGNLHCIAPTKIFDNGEGKVCS